MLKQFLLQLGEAAAAASRFDILNLDIIDGGPGYCYNLTVRVSFRLSSLFAWRRLCQGQATWPLVQRRYFIFPKLFCLLAQKISWTNFAAHQPWNLFQLMSSSITDDRENGNNLFYFFEDHHFSGPRFPEIAWCSPKWCWLLLSPWPVMAGFSRLWQKICNNKKYFERTRGTHANIPRHTVWETLR